MNDNNSVSPLVSLTDVCKMTSLSRFLIRALEKDGKFPKSVQLGAKRIAYVRSELEEWINDKIAQRCAA
ncbi:AlpA family phage regulatory protein [Ochrobactrum sp. MC-1LL]|uniref:helix-turn-helix transcriptional regulator n=1 Tax=Ochrobactrum sp. MC-1LL TaxID=2735351 RepID=UPI001438501C|nr:AlpA family phage regulatory protein [Ochrobactrum sp. MC-1LL]NKE75027.1 AlpA family phage regulatory protein [Ochrobactrum sp. MC-1LL]